MTTPATRQTKPYSTAREEYERALNEYQLAKQRVTEAKRKLIASEGRARSTKSRDAQRLASRRQQVLRTRPDLRALAPAARRQALDAVLAARDAPCVWKFYLDTMHFDSVTRAPKLFAANRQRFELYRAALTLHAKRLREQASKGSAVDDPYPPELRGNARTIELHLQTLEDRSPREVRVNYPSEWAVITKALRPEGSKPKGKAARRLYALYQHIVRTHTVET